MIIFEGNILIFFLLQSYVQWYQSLQWRMSSDCRQWNYTYLWPGRRSKYNSQSYWCDRRIWFNSMRLDSFSAKLCPFRSNLQKLKNIMFFFNFQEIVFVLNGNRLELTSFQYVFQVKISKINPTTCDVLFQLYFVYLKLTTYDDKLECYSGFIGQDMQASNGFSWIFGINFMGAYYTEFDAQNMRIGFAKSNSNI